jgi:hypothetical protein
VFLIFSILFIITCRHRACPPPRIFQQLPVPWSGQESGPPLLHHLGPFLSESTSGTSVATPSSINQSDPDGPDVDSLNDEHHLGILAAGNVVEGCHQSNDGDSDAAGNDDSDADYYAAVTDAAAEDHRDDNHDSDDEDDDDVSHHDGTDGALGGALGTDGAVTDAAEDHRDDNHDSDGEDDDDVSHHDGTDGALGTAGAVSDAAAEDDNHDDNHDSDGEADDGVSHHDGTDGALDSEGTVAAAQDQPIHFEICEDGNIRPTAADSVVRNMTMQRTIEPPGTYPSIFGRDEDAKSEEENDADAEETESCVPKVPDLTDKGLQWMPQFTRKPQIGDTVAVFGGFTWFHAIVKKITKSLFFLDRDNVWGELDKQGADTFWPSRYAQFWYLYEQQEQAAGTHCQSDTDSEEGESQTLSNKILNNTTHFSGIKSCRPYTDRELELHKESMVRLNAIKQKNDEELNSALACIPGTAQYEAQLKADEEFAKQLAGGKEPVRKQKPAMNLKRKKGVTPARMEPTTYSVPNQPSRMSPRKKAKTIVKTIVTKKSTSTNAAAQTTKEVLLEKFKVINKANEKGRPSSQRLQKHNSNYQKR